MNRYKIDIYLSNGDRVEGRSVGDTPLEAQQRILQTQELQQFIGELTIERMTVELERREVVDEVEHERYRFEPSQEKPGWYVVTDTVDMVVMTFEHGRLNETGHITPLTDDDLEPAKMAWYVRKFGDYLRAYHPEVVE